MMDCSAASMNAIGGFRAYSVYPYLTFHKRAGVVLGQHDEDKSLPSLVTDPLDKLLQARGYRAIQGYDLEKEVGVPREVSQGRRFCGDEHTLVWEFKAGELGWPEAFPLLQRNSWNLVIHRTHASRPFFETEVQNDRGHFYYEGNPRVLCTTGFNTVDPWRDLPAVLDKSAARYWGRQKFDLEQIELE